MNKQDYYNILGLHRDADAKAIKKAYRQLARRYHPDVNKSDDAAEKFQQVQEAYQVLNDPDQRKIYDQFGHAGLHAQSQGAHAGGSQAGATGAYHQAGHGGGGGYYWTGGPVGGGGCHAVDFDVSDLFGDLFGAGGSRMGGARSAVGSRGEDLHHTVEIDFDQAVNGSGVSLTLTDASGGRQQLDVKIPQGTNDGAKLRLRGKGHQVSGGEAGDLILTVRVRPHRWFKREGLDLLVDVPVTIAEATLGGQVEVPALNGTASLQVPAGTASGRKLRMRGAGVEDANGRRGDLYAVIQIVPPASLTDAQREQVQALASSLPNPRAGRWR